MFTAFDPRRLLMNDLPGSFLLEVFFRSAVMYVLALVVLRLAGRRGVKQLSLFELVIIITLGSAAGDPLLYEDVGLLPALTVFATVLGLYRLTTHLVAKSKKVDRWLEGNPLYLVEEGEFAIDNFRKGALAQDEFFAELRLRSVDHLGQVRLALLETSGQLSVFFYADAEVRYGLPILPHAFRDQPAALDEGVPYACTFCGHVKLFDRSQPAPACPRCRTTRWAKACRGKRIA